MSQTVDGEHAAVGGGQPVYIANLTPLRRGAAVAVEEDHREPRTGILERDLMTTGVSNTGIKGPLRRLLDRLNRRRSVQRRRWRLVQLLNGSLDVPTIGLHGLNVQPPFGD